MIIGEKTKGWTTLATPFYRAFHPPAMRSYEPKECSRKPAIAYKRMVTDCSSRSVGIFLNVDTPWEK